MRGLLVPVPQSLRKRRRLEGPIRKRLLPLHNADVGPGSPLRDAGWSFRSEGRAAGPRPTLKGRSTLRSMFASVTPSVQWEYTQYHWGRPEAPTCSYRQPDCEATLHNCPRTLLPPTAPQPSRRSPRAGTCLRALRRTRASLPAPPAPACAHRSVAPSLCLGSSCD